MDARALGMMRVYKLRFREKRCSVRVPELREFLNGSDESVYVGGWSG